MDTYRSRLLQTKTINDFIRLVAGRYSDGIAFEIRRRIVREKVYYRDLPQLIKKIDAFLYQQGIKPKDTIILFGLNCPEYSLLLLTIFATGRIAVPVDYRSGDDLVAKIIEQTKPKAAFVSRFLKSEVFKQYSVPTFFFENLYFLLVEDKAVQKRNLLKGKPEELCEIVFTSGTTGTPKGVMITPENILTNFLALYKRMPKMSAYRTISVLPLSHMFEQVAGLFLSLSYGSRIVYLPLVNSYRLKKAMAEVKPTFLLFVPQLLTIFWQRIESEIIAQNKYDVFMRLLKLVSPLPRLFRKSIFRRVHKQFGSKLEYIGVGGAPLNYQIAGFFNRMGFQILEGYGATEVTAAACFNHNPDALGTVGMPLEGVEIKLDDDNQIVIKSKSISNGYFKNKQKTDEVFHNGWYKTGDIGVFSPNGSLSIVGRDFFKIVTASGEKVYVEDVEKTINNNRYIKDSCVVAIKDNGADKLHAVVILKESHDEIALKKIVADINAQLESRQQILDYSVWPADDFPRTHTLKTDRKLVSKIISEGLPDKESLQNLSIKTPTQLSLADILSVISKIEVSKIADSDLLASDLGLDSLDRGELIALIEEHLGLSIPVTQITSRTTVSDVKTMIKNSQTISETTSFHTWQYTWWGELVRFVFLQLFIFPMHGLFVRLNVKGVSFHSLPQKSIVIFNHVGLFDGVAVLRLLGNKAHRVTTPVYSGFWTKKILTTLIEMTAGGLPLDQSGQTLIPLMQYVSDLVDEGRYLLFAPQGRLQKNPIQDRFKVGIGYFAQELDLPVIPIKLVNYETIWPSPQKDAMHIKLKEYFPQKIGKVIVKVGKPIYPHTAKTPPELANLIEEAFTKL